MRKLALGAAVAMALTLGVSFTHAADEHSTKVTGTLIDDSCAAKFADKDNPQVAAEKHPVACAIKCGKDGKFVLLHGKEKMTLDKHGQELAMAYLTKPEASSKVTISGEKAGDELKVESIVKAEPAH